MWARRRSRRRERCGASLFRGCAAIGRWRACVRGAAGNGARRSGRAGERLRHQSGGVEQEEDRMPQQRAVGACACVALGVGRVVRSTHSGATRDVRPLAASSPRAVQRPVCSDAQASGVAPSLTGPV
eukprot:2214353-Prymnesium_polylepis.1